VANRHDVQHITYHLPKEDKKDKKPSVGDEFLGAVLAAAAFFLGWPLFVFALRLAFDFWFPERYRY